MLNLPEEKMKENNRYDYSPIITRPPLRWPDNARIAIWIIINIEHYKIDKPATSLYPSPTNFPDVLNFGWRDYGPRVGVWRLMSLLDEFGIKASVALNSDVCHHNPVLVEEGLKRNWEFLCHGITNSQILSGMQEEEERSVVREVIGTIEKTTGKKPLGWLGPALSETYNTPDILAEEGIMYICDWCNDDQPYLMKVRKGSLLSVPYTLELNDIPAFLGYGYTPEIFKQVICDQFDVLYDEGKETGRVMAIALHPFIMGHPFRIKHFKQALEYITQHNDIWMTTGSEIAKYFVDNRLPSEKK